MELISNKTHVQEFKIRGENHQLLTIPPLTKWYNHIGWPYLDLAEVAGIHKPL